MYFAKFMFLYGSDWTNPNRMSYLLLTTGQWLVAMKTAIYVRWSLWKNHPNLQDMQNDVLHLKSHTHLTDFSIDEQLCGRSFAIWSHVSMRHAVSSHLIDVLCICLYIWSPNFVPQYMFQNVRGPQICCDRSQHFQLNELNTSASIPRSQNCVIFVLVVLFKSKWLKCS